MSTVLTRLRRFLHRTPPARVAAHHSLRKDFRAPRIAPPKLPTRHTYRDPTTGRYTRREQ